MTLWRGRRKRSYLGKLLFLFQFCLHFKLFFFGASPSFDAIVFRAVNLAFDSILLSQAFFSNFLVVVWLLSVFGYLRDPVEFLVLSLMVSRYASGIDLAYFVMCQEGTLMIQFVSLTNIVLWKGNRRHCVALEFHRERASTK